MHTKSGTSSVSLIRQHLAGWRHFGISKVWHSTLLPASPVLAAFCAVVAIMTPKISTKQQQNNPHPSHSPAMAFGDPLPFSFSQPGAVKNPSPLINSFGASATPSASANGTSSFTDDDCDVLDLQPAAFSRADKAKWKASGRSFLAAASPVNGEIMGWTTGEKKDTSDVRSTARLR